MRAIAVDQATGVAVGEDGVWAVSQGRRTLERIDPQRNTVVARIQVALTDEGDTGPERVAAGEGGVWVTHPETAVISRIDPAANKVTARIRLRGFGSPVDIATGDGAVWVATESHLVRLDPESGKATAAAEARGSFSSVTVGEGGVWATDTGTRGVAGFEPSS